MIEYKNIISLETLDIVDYRTGYIDIKDIKDITWKRIENTRRHGKLEKYYKYY